MAESVGEDGEQLRDGDLDRLRSRGGFRVIAAFVGDELAGGVMAHTRPMTRTASSAVFIYAIAVRDHHRRTGVGRRLGTALREGALAVGKPGGVCPCRQRRGPGARFLPGSGRRAICGDMRHSLRRGRVMQSCSTRPPFRLPLRCLGQPPNPSEDPRGQETNSPEERIFRTFSAGVQAERRPLLAPGSVFIAGGWCTNAAAPPTD